MSSIRDARRALARSTDAGFRFRRIRPARSLRLPRRNVGPIYVPPISKLVLDEYGSIEAARTALQREVERLEKKAQAEIEAKGWKFLGADRCMKTRITKRAKAYEVWGSRNPTFADGGDPAIRELMIERRQTFRSRYNQNLASWRAGNRSVVFPAGTWKMHVLHRARRHPPPHP